MNTKQDYFRSLGNTKEKSQYNSTKNVLKRYFFHWPLFIIGLTFFVAAGVFYLNFVKPTYEIKASILIKDDKKPGGDSPQAAMLHEIGLASSSDGVENEIGILKSKKLIGKVVQDFQLWVTYKKKDGPLISEDLYKETPVRVVYLNNTQKLDRQFINVVVKDNKSFFLKDSNDKLTELFFDKPYHSKFGTWKLEPTKSINDYRGSNIKILFADPDKTTVAFQKLIDVTLPNKLATSVNLTVTDKVPQRGKDILNGLISNYNSSSAVYKNQETKNTIDFLDQRIDSLSRGLTASEKGIEGFKSSRGLTDLSSEAQIQLQNMQVNDNNLNEINIKLNIIDGVEKYVNSDQNSEKAPATLGITDPALSNSIEKLSLLQLQHDKLAATMPETNPDFDPINSQIKTTKAAIRENVKNIKASLIGTKQKLESYNNKFESSIKSMPTQEREYVSIKRQQTSKENLYTFLLQQREQVSIKSAASLVNNRIVDQAYVETPQDLTIIILVVSILCGIGFPAGVIYIRNSLTTKITNIHDINDTLTVPVVSELPYEKIKTATAINGSHISAISEQLRALRIKLFYLHKEKAAGRVTLITSSVPGEGKSFISTNLSLVLTLADRKTVILELDMRKPKVAKSFGLVDSHSGMSEYLNGKVNKEDIIQKSESIPNLYIISCGSIVNNPSELLEKKLLKDLIASLREEFDDIIIDSPPVHLVPDAIVLSRLADITLYIIRQGVTDKAELNFINQLADQTQLHNINIIFNGIERVKNGYGYKYDNAYYTNTRNSFFAPAFGDFKSRF
jgi:tyrosine-protein kinase Etk/Wzc